MRILSWNIQCGMGCDGVVDLQRIIDYVRDQDAEDPLDLICLQELARDMDQYCAPGQPDQLAMMDAAFADHVAVWGPGFSWPGVGASSAMRREFGNLTLVRLPLLDFRVYPLPMPPAPDRLQMQRVAIETVVGSRIGDLSIVNNHLAYHDQNENLRQVERLNELEQERHGRINNPGKKMDGSYAQKHLPAARVLCGDFNFAVDSRQYRYQLSEGWTDAAQPTHGDTPRVPTCGIFDREQWPEGPHCRDFFWLSEELRCVDATVTVDVETSLSDHQPIELMLDI